MIVGYHRQKLPPQAVVQILVRHDEVEGTVRMPSGEGMQERGKFLPGDHLVDSHASDVRDTERSADHEPKNKVRPGSVIGRSARTRNRHPRST
jgi:hypothetical protein